MHAFKEIPVYLNNAATSWPKPDIVKAAVRDSLEQPLHGAERGGGLHVPSVTESTRAKVHSFFSFPNTFQIAFIHSATVGLNLVIRSIIEKRDNDKCHFITTNVEHNSVYRPLLQSMKKGESTFEIVEFVDANGQTYENRIIDALNSSTKAVIMSNASNVTGQVFNFESLYSELQKRNVLLIVDATQSLGCRCFRYSEILGDAIICSTHKHMLSIPGAGILAFNTAINIVPLYFGGTGKQSGILEQPYDLPSMLEAGTYNTMAIASLSAAIDFFVMQTEECIRSRITQHSIRFCEEAAKVKKMKICHPHFCETGAGIFTFNIDGLNPNFIVNPYLADKNIVIRPGLHCAPQIHKTLGTFPDGANRVSFSIFNTEEDIGILFEAIRELIR